LKSQKFFHCDLSQFVVTKSVMADRQTINAGAHEIEVTPEMIAAAVKVIAEDYGVCSEYAAEGLVEDILKAMIAARTNRVAINAEKPPGTA
jgi:hypothetical protein